METLNSTIQEIQTDIQRGESEILFSSRKGILLHHSKFAPCAVLHLHGLYQSPKDWESQVLRSYVQAQNLGEKIFVVGHSTGGLLRLGRFNKSGLDPEYDNYFKPAQAGVLVEQTIEQLRMLDWSKFHTAALTRSVA